MVVHFGSLLALCIANEIVVLEKMHVIDSSCHVLLVLGADITGTRDINALRVSILLLML